MKARLDVVAAVIFRDGKFLIAKRKGSSRHGGKWEFPGGKVEVGESQAASLKRELLEELGVTVAVNGKILESEFDYPDFRVRLHFYDVKIDSGALAPLAHEEIKWVKSEDLNQIDFIEADMLALEGIKAAYIGRVAG